MLLAIIAFGDYSQYANGYSRLVQSTGRWTGVAKGNTIALAFAKAIIAIHLL